MTRLGRVDQETGRVEEGRMLAKGRLRSLYTDYTLDKLGRDKMMFQISDDIICRTRWTHPDSESAKISKAFSVVSSEMVQDLIFDENVRVDGRGLADIRPISCTMGQLFFNVAIPRSCAPQP